MSTLQTSAIPIEQIRESPHNHRKHFDEARLAELIESVKAHGVLQPVLVRPAVKPFGKVKYELVYGHRRFRAARLAKLKEIPATVRELDDRAALEVALIENCRREDVLPMEEAEGYRELHEAHGVSVEQLAERVGKSKEYVYARLKLCELKSPGVREALDAGRVSPSTALLVARIPGEKLQEAAAKRILEGGAWDEETGKQGPMSYRRAERLVQEEYMLQLSKAPFNVKDAALVREAGACGTCPKKSGNQRAELFPDVKSPNVCTDPDCFGRKKAAAFRAQAAAAKAEGKMLLKDSKALWGWDGKELGYKGKEKYVELGEKCPGDKKGRTFKELLGGKAPVVLARDPNGKVHELLEKEGLSEALAAAGHKVKMPEERRGAGMDYAAETAKRRQEESFRERVVQRLLDSAVDKVRKRAVGEEKALRLIARFFVSPSAGWDLAPGWKRRGVEDLESAVAEAEIPGLLAVVLEGVFLEPLNNLWNGYAPLTEELCEMLGVKLDVIEREQRDEDAAAPKKEDAGNVE